jgi:hypothetical protein
MTKIFGVLFIDKPTKIQAMSVLIYLVFGCVTNISTQLSSRLSGKIDVLKTGILSTIGMIDRFPEGSDTV